MKYIKLFICAFVLAIVYATGVLNIKNIYPELFVVFVGVFCLTFKNFKDNCLVGVIFGVIMSAFSGRGFAFCVLVVTYLAILANAMPIVKRSLIQCVVLVFVYTIAYESLFYYIGSNSNNIGFGNAFSTVIINASIYNGVIAVIFYPIVKKMFYVHSRIFK